MSEKLDRVPDNSKSANFSLAKVAKLRDKSDLSKSGCPNPSYDANSDIETMEQDRRQKSWASMLREYRQKETWQRTLAERRCRRTTTC
jgi:hypothetical protein